MNIKTQKLLNEIHQIRVKLQLHQNKNGYDYECETYIQQCSLSEDYINFMGFTNSNESMEESVYQEVRYELQPAFIYAAQFN